MKIERTKNAVRNIVFGGFLKIYQIVVPFLMRTVMIYALGMNYLGLNSLFTSILQVLNLAELGVGSAMVYSMYKPIAEGDSKAICALMRLYRLYYRVIGAAVAVMGAILIPFLPYLVKTDTVPQDINIYILYVCNLFITVLSYWLFAYKNCLLNAHQRTDVVSKISLATNTAMYLLQLIVLLVFHNYYLYVIVHMIVQVCTNIVTAIVAGKMYPGYDPKGDLPKEEVARINGRVRDLFTSKLGSVILNSADTIVVSAFLGLTVLAVYQNYYFIVTSVIGIVSVVFAACIAGIGNSIIVETKEKNYRDFKKFTFMITWISGFCACCLLNLLQPFIKLWTGEKNMLTIGAVVCFCIYYFLYELNMLFNLYKDAAGVWHEDRFRPLVTSLANLTMNLIMVQFWGIYGVLLSTVLAMLFIGMPWLLHNIFSTVFRKDLLKGYFFNLLGYVAIVLISCVVTYLSCSVIDFSNLYLTLLLRLAVCTVLSNGIYFVCFSRREEFLQSLQMLDHISRGKLHLAARLGKKN